MDLNDLTFTRLPEVPLPTEAAIVTLEEQLGAALPKDYREFLRVFGGAYAELEVPVTEFHAQRRHPFDQFVHNAYGRPRTLRRYSLFSVELPCATEHDLHRGWRPRSRNVPFFRRGR